VQTGRGELKRRMQTLQDHQRQMGAQLNDNNVPLSFGNEVQAIAAAKNGVALYDRSHWGRLRVEDRDRLSFLHNQTTNDLKRLQPGQGCETVLLTSTARTIDLLSVYVTAEDILVLTSPNRRADILSWLDRYIFFGDQVQLIDITAKTVCFSLMGSQSTDLLHKLGVAELPQALDCHCVSVIANVPVRIACGSGLSGVGYTAIADWADSVVLWQALVGAGAVPLGEQSWEQLRIYDGRPTPGAELTEDYNPLEAGLWHTISFNKGCYIGQETIARLNTYSGVKQQLWGINLQHFYQPGELIYVEDHKVGVLTSISSDGRFGLGYIKTKAGGAGLTVHIGEEIATTVGVPFLSREPAAELTQMG
jgi:tRNA-modifying protein YgfZ